MSSDLKSMEHEVSVASLADGRAQVLQTALLRRTPQLQVTDQRDGKGVD